MNKDLLLLAGAATGSYLTLLLHQYLTAPKKTWNYPTFRDEDTLATRLTTNVIASAAIAKQINDPKISASTFFLSFATLNVLNEPWNQESSETKTTPLYKKVTQSGICLVGGLIGFTAMKLFLNRR